jgi:hypothetical protein
MSDTHTDREARLARIADLERQMAAVKAEIAEADEVLRKSVTPTYEFTFTKQSSDSGFGEKIADPAVLRYRLDGKCSNYEELKAAGWSDHSISSGGMDYLFNSATGKFIMAIGGGRIWISDGRFGMHLGAMAELADFIADSPEGGDVTSIITKYANEKKGL